jgi:hypothetical protein
MPRSKTVARNRPFPADNPEWPRARKAQLRRTVLQRMAKLRDSVANPHAPTVSDAGGWPSAHPAGPAAREEPCDAAEITPSMPR